MNTFVRDDSLVVSSAGNAGAPIEQSGAYVGVFTQAKQRIAKTGTRGVEFSFEATDGAVARYLTLWVERAGGERIEYAYGILSGLMVCLDVKAITSESVVSEEWDSALGTRVPTKIEAYPELVNRQVGVVLQREEQEWEGRARVSMRIVDFFNPVSRQTPAELLSGTGATGQLDRIVGGLKDKIFRAAPPAAVAATARPGPVRSSPGDFSDEDIPF
jgi:hypothetical protein